MHLKGEVGVENVRAMSAAVGAFLAWAIGGFDYLFQILVIFAIIDYASGLTAAWINHEVSSQKGLRGIAKKTFILTLVIVADKIDFMLGGNDFLRNSILYGLIANETISILENAGRMGIPIPKPFYLALEKLKSKSEEEVKHESST